MDGKSVKRKGLVVCMSAGLVGRGAAYGKDSGGTVVTSQLSTTGWSRPLRKKPRMSFGPFVCWLCLKCNGCEWLDRGCYVRVIVSIATLGTPIKQPGFQHFAPSTFY